MNLKSHVHAALGLLLLLFFFYPTLFLAKAAPLTGDHWEQHYPWAHLLSESLRSWKLPFWTSKIHSGFPIAAESQIGIFYLPNLLFYKSLPFHWAYSYMNLFHFFLAGFGTYLYAKRIGNNPQAAFLSGVLFTFGAAFGGAFYNMTSLKTISWFPLVLYATESYLHSKKWLPLMAIAFAISQSLVAGYLQIALFTWFFYAIYVGLRILVFNDAHPGFGRYVTIMSIGSMLLLSALLSLPQTILTFELAKLSSRVGLAENYAYIGSLSPLSLVTLFDPVAQYAFRGNNLYMGIISLFFIIAGIIQPEKNKFVKLWICLLCIAFLLALGRWSPLYVGLIKLTEFYSFRVPAKFLGFICFSLSILAGSGFQHLFYSKHAELKLTIARTRFFFFVALSLFLVFAVVFFLLMTVGETFLMRIGEWYLEHFYYGKSGHPRTLDEYFNSLRSFKSVLLNLYSIYNFENMRTFIVIGLSVLFGLYFKLGTSAKWLKIALVFLMIDLYSFSWIDIKQDFTYYEKAEQTSSITRELIKLKDSGALARLYSFRKNGTSVPVSPSNNMLYGIEDIGCYSPLVVDRYYQSIGLFGNVNNSTNAYSPTPEYLYDRLLLLAALDVSHILSNEPLSHADLSLVYHEPPYYLYRLGNKHQRIYFHTMGRAQDNWESLKQTLLSPRFDPSKEILLEQTEINQINSFPGFTDGEAAWNFEIIEQEDHHARFIVHADRPGFFTRMETADASWEITVNGTSQPLIRAYGLFQAVYLPEAGNYDIRFTYKPYSQLFRRTP